MVSRATKTSMIEDMSWERITKYLLTHLFHTQTISQYTNSSALIVGKDYPHPDGLDYVRRKWKEALRDPQNCKLIPNNNNNDVDIAKENERILRKAVGKGRYVIREMEGTIQLKKYRTMRRRYGEVSVLLCAECSEERMTNKI